MSNTLALVGTKKGATPAKGVAAKIAAKTTPSKGVAAKPAGKNGAAAEAAKPKASAAAAAAVKTEAKPALGKGAQALTGGTKVASKPAALAKGDLFQQTKMEIDLLTEKDATQVINSLVNARDYDYFKLGGILHAVQQNGWFGDHKNFKEYVQNETDLHYRKATTLTAMYEKLVGSEIAWADVAEVGWSKLAIMAPILTTKNVGKWVKKSMEMTSVQLLAAVQAEKNKDADKADESKMASDLTTKTFKLHKDQKETVNDAVEKAKEMFKTEYDAVAIENICLDFVNMTGKKKASPAATAAALKDFGFAKSLEVLEKAWPGLGFAITTFPTDASKEDILLLGGKVDDAEGEAGEGEAGEGEGGESEEE